MEEGLLGSGTSGVLCTVAASLYYRRNFTESGRAIQENRNAEEEQPRERSDEDVARARFGFERSIVPQLFTYEATSYTAEKTSFSKRAFLTLQLPAAATYR